MYFTYHNKAPNIIIYDDFGVAFDLLDISSPQVIFQGIAKVDEGLYITSAEELEVFLVNNSLDLLRRAEGSFFSIVITQSDIFFINDRFQREGFFLYENSDAFVVSNSLLLLSRECKSCGLRLSINKTVARASFIDHFMFDQAFSKHSLFNEINNLLPPNSISIRKSDFAVSIKSDPTVVKIDLSYEELLVKGAKSITQDLIFLKQSFNECIVNLTGGHDSRVLFGALLNIDQSIDVSNISVKSGTEPAFIEDFKVASHLCQTYGVNLNEQRESKRSIQPVDPDQALKRWSLCNAGQYYYMNLSTCYFPDNFDLLSIRGGGGEVLKGSYDTSLKDFIGYMKAKYSTYWSEDLEKILLESLKNIEPIVPFDDSNFIDMHYFLYRNRIHFGRNSIDKSRWTYFYDPLMNKFLVSAALGLKRQDIYAAKITRDLLLLLKPSLLEHLFDSPEKSFSEDSINASIFKNQDKLAGHQYCSNYPNKYSSQPSVSRGKWLEANEFERQIDSMMIGAIENNLHIEWYAELVKPVMSKYIQMRSEPASVYLPAARRQIAKCFTLALFMEMCSPTGL